MLRRLILLSFIITLMSPAWAEDRLRLETTIIKGNKEMPQILYVVPWQDMKHSGPREQTLVLHSLYGDIFEPVSAEPVAMERKSASSNQSKP